MQGGRWVNERCGYLQIPLLARENSIIAWGKTDERADYDYDDGVELRVYALSGRAQVNVCDIHGDTVTSLLAERSDSALNLYA